MFCFAHFQNVAQHVPYMHNLKFILLINTHHTSHHTIPNHTTPHQTTFEHTSPTTHTTPLQNSKKPTGPTENKMVQADWSLVTETRYLFAEQFSEGKKKKRNSSLNSSTPNLNNGDEVGGKVSEGRLIG